MVEPKKEELKKEAPKEEAKGAVKAAEKGMVFEKQVIVDGNKKTRKVVVDIQIPLTVADMINDYGPDNVTHLLHRAVKDAYNAEANRVMSAGPHGALRRTDAQVIAALKAFKPGENAQKRERLAQLEQIRSELLAED